MVGGLTLGLWDPGLDGEVEIMEGFDIIKDSDILRPMAKPRVKPFRFKNLEFLSRQQVNLHEGVMRYLPAALPAEIFLDRITKQLARYMRQPVQFEMTALREPDFQKYCSTVPDPAVLFVLGCTPLDRRAFLQVDFALAHIMVDRMLGGEGEYSPDLKPLTPIEEGVLQFLILKILTFFAQAVEGKEVQFRLETLLSDPKQLKEYGQLNDLMALISIQVTLGKKAGFVRLALPHPLVEGMVSTLAPFERNLKKKDLKRLQRMVNVKLPIWIELGHLDIKHTDLEKLESGDVVLLDQCFVEIGSEGVTGEVTLRVQDGVGGGFKGNILNSQEDLIEVEISEAF